MKNFDNMTGDEILAEADRLSNVRALQDALTNLEVVKGMATNAIAKIHTIEETPRAWILVLRLNEIVKELESIANNYGLQ